MARKPLIRTATGYYHITVRVNHKDVFPLPLGECWKIFLYLLSEIGAKFGADVHAFVLMSNHYHLMLSTPLLNVDKVMKYVNREATRAIGSKSGLCNHVFGARYHWTLTYNPANTAHVLKYIYRNPVKAELVRRVEDYPYSSVAVYWDSSNIPFIRPPRELTYDGDPECVLRWLNEPLGSEQEDLIRRAGRKREFKFTNDPAHQAAIQGIPEFPFRKSIHTPFSIC